MRILNEFLAKRIICKRIVARIFNYNIIGYWNVRTI